MEVERLTAVLEASGLSGFQSVMDIADRAMGSSQRNAETLAAVSKVATDALQKIRMTADQAAATSGVSDSMKRALADLSYTAEHARADIERVKMSSAQAAESDAAGDVIDRKLKDITGNANEARRSLESVKLTSTSLDTGGSGGGSNGSPGLAGFGRGVLLPAAIGVGALAAPAAGPAIIGLLSAIPALAGGAAGAIGTLALAFDGVGAAIGGDKKAFDALMPSQQQFVLMVRSLSGELDTLKQTAAGATFPGLTAALHSALSPGTLNAVTNAVKEFGGAIGSAAEQWGKYLGSGEFQQLFGPIMAEGAKGLDTMSGAALSLFDALGVLGRAAGPLVDWLTKSMAAGSAWLDVWLKGKDATGQLAAAMTEAQTSLKLVAGLVESLAQVVIALGTALYPVSQVFVKDLTDGLNVLAKMIGNNQDAIRTIVGGALADLVATLKAAASGIGFVIDGWATLVGRKNAVVGAITAIGFAFALLTDTNPILLAVAATVIGVGEIIRHWEAFKNWMVEWGPIILAPFTAGASVAVGLIINHWSTIKQWFEDFAKFLPGLFGAMWTAIKGITDLAVYGMLAVFDELLKAIAGAIGHIPFIGSSIKSALDDAAGYIDSFRTNGIKDLQDAGQQMGDSWATAFKPPVQAALDSVQQSMQMIAQGAGTFTGGKGAPKLNAAGGYTGGVVNTAAAKAYIATAAAAYGLDPNALIGVATNESANWSGGIGDGGHAFGPFQLNNAGGALTGKFPGQSAQQINKWAWSQPGIQYALSGIAASGAKGLTGTAAVDAIVKNFERPKDPTADLAAGYKAVGGAPPSVTTGAGSAGLFGPEPAWTTNAGPTKAQTAAATLATNLAAEHTKIAAVTSQINQDLSDKALSSDVAAELKKHAAAINASLSGAGKDALPGIRTNLTTLKAQLQDGLAQATDDKKLKTTVAAIKDDLKNKLLSSDVGQALLAQAAKLNSQLTGGLIDDATRKQVEQKITDLKAKLKLDLTLDDDTKTLKASVGQLNQAVSSGLFPAPLAELARKQAAAIGDKIAQGTQAAANTAKAQLKALAATIKEGIADATAIQNYQQTMAKFGTGLQASLNQTLGIAQAYATPTVLAAAQQGAANIMAALARGLTGSALAQAKNSLKQYEQTIEDALNGMVQLVSTSRTTYETAWQRLATAGDTAFDNVTSQTVTKMQKDLSTAIAAMQIQVQTAYGSFLYGGAITQTPTEALLAQMQAQHQADQDANAVSGAQTQLATDQAASADPATILSDQQALDDALYQQQVDSLQQQADAERTAADKQLQDAQNAAQAQGDLQVQAYQDQRDQQKQALDDQVQAIETAFEQGTISAKTAFAEMTKLYTQNGIDITTLSVTIAGNIYTGVSAWTAPIMDLMSDLQSQIAATEAALGMLPQTPGLGNTPGSGTTSSGGGNYYQSGTGPYGGKPLLAKGGIVTSRTEAIIGEAGPEAVIPLAKLGSIGAGQTVNLVVQALDPASVDWDEIATKVRDAFARMARSGFANPWGSP